MNNKTTQYYVDNDYIDKRADLFLKSKMNLNSRSYIKKLIDLGCIFLNQKKLASASKKVKEGDIIVVREQLTQKNKILPEKINLDIVYEDNDLIVVNKPAGMVVHPGAGNKNGTLVNGLMFKLGNKLSNLGGSERPGIIHRLDKDTSGLIVAAKNNFAHNFLSEQFSKRTIIRKYTAFVWGVIRPLNGNISTLISRDKFNRQKMSVSSSKGKHASTKYKTLKVFQNKDIPKISLIEFKLETGRTHQIRVHMKYKKTNILGDKVYGKKRLKFKKVNNILEKKIQELKGQMLHAGTLGFVHPKNNKIKKFSIEPPKKFKNLLNFLENNSN